MMRQQAEMRQKNAGVLVALVALGILAFRGMRGSKDEAAATLQGWSVQVSQRQTATMAHAVERTITAKGLVTNPGQLLSAYRVALVRGNTLIDVGNISIPAGNTVQVTLSGGLSLEAGEAATFFVDLDRVSPNAATEIDSAGPFSYTESHGHTVGGSLSGWSTTVAQQHGRHRRRGGLRARIAA